MGILCGASPQRVGELGAMAAKLEKAEIDVLIDSSIPCVSELVACLSRRYPGLGISVVNMNGWRACRIFDWVAQAKMFVGYRSAATYMAAMMQVKTKKKLLEVMKVDFPAWFLEKNLCSDYCSFNSGDLALDVLTLMCSELIEGGAWTIFDMNSRGSGQTEVYNQFFAGIAAAR